MEDQAAPHPRGSAFRRGLQGARDRRLHRRVQDRRRRALRRRQPHELPARLRLHPRLQRRPPHAVARCASTARPPRSCSTPLRSSSSTWTRSTSSTPASEDDGAVARVRRAAGAPHEPALPRSTRHVPGRHPHPHGAIRVQRRRRARGRAARVPLARGLRRVPSPARRAPGRRHDHVPQHGAAARRAHDRRRPRPAAAERARRPGPRSSRPATAATSTSSC